MGHSRRQPYDYDRKFDTWNWADPLVTARKVGEIEVRIQGCTNPADGPTKFYVDHREPTIKLESGSLDELRRQVDAHLAALFALTWKPKILVRIENREETQEDEEDGYTDTEISTLIHISYWEEAQDPQGAWWHRRASTRKRTRGKNAFGEYSLRLHEGSLAEARAPTTHVGDEEDEERAREQSPRERVILLDDTDQNRALVQRSYDVLVNAIVELDGHHQGAALPHRIERSPSYEKRLLRKTAKAL